MQINLQFSEREYLRGTMNLNPNLNLNTNPNTGGGDN